jgi:D-ribose pyranase
MKTGTILNPDLCEAIASMGHTDMLCVADAGLPIPDDVWRIDLALTKGIPAFLDTLRVILTDFRPQEVIVAAEMAKISPAMLEQVKAALGSVPFRTVPHTEFKEMTHDVKAVVRTGEFTPYCNVILVAAGF